MRRLAQVVAAIAVAIGVAACGGPSAAVYPPLVQNTYLTACDATTPKASACTCTLKWFEANRTLAQFQADVAKMNAGETPPDATKAVAACR